MTIREAILTVMKEEGEPLTVDRIYDLIIERELYSFKAKEPKGVVRFTIRRQCMGIDFPSSNLKEKYFKLLEGNLYAPLDKIITDNTKDSIVYENNESTINQQILELAEEQKQQFIDETINYLKKIDHYEFEVFSKDLLESFGLIDVEVTNRGPDGGIDGFAKHPTGLTHLNVAFQSKRWKKAVGRRYIDQFRGAIYGKNLHQGIILTPSYFTSNSIEAAQRENTLPIILLDGNAIAKIMIDKEFRVERKTVDLYNIK